MPRSEQVTAAQVYTLPVKLPSLSSFAFVLDYAYSSGNKGLVLRYNIGDESPASWPGQACCILKCFVLAYPLEHSLVPPSIQP
jgi:hypothetical protein